MIISRAMLTDKVQTRFWFHAFGFVWYRGTVVKLHKDTAESQERLHSLHNEPLNHYIDYEADKLPYKQHKMSPGLLLMYHRLIFLFTWYFICLQYVLVDVCLYWFSGGNTINMKPLTPWNMCTCVMMWLNWKKYTKRGTALAFYFIVF